MIRKIKFGKIAIVIFLTVLIWVWTDLDLDEVHTIPRVMMRVAKSSELLVSFNGQPEASINNIELKGPAKKITEVRRELDGGTRKLDFTLNPEREGMTTTGSHALKVLDFLKRSDEIKELGGLAVEDCKPEIIEVNVVKLEKKLLEIECVNENGVPLTPKSIEPEKVEMYVPADSRLKAKVQLTSRDITQARLSVAVKTPYVELAPGQTRMASNTVNIKMLPEADSLTEYSIDAKLGITLGLNLVGEYKPEIPTSSYNDLVSFSIFATAAAKEAYESQPYQITLYIFDDDKKKGPDEEQRRDVVYNFPEEYLRKNEIRLKNQPEEAKFKLIPLNPAKTPPAGTN
ncbi:MAG: hypothetical protein H8D56_07755 [Planctomycetes bacterium]|nr:hypothetical protein [Planctomycetota bacterium]MBL7143030.1 hypothetical protein [Phycisphaerae bacterium]